MGADLMDGLVVVGCSRRKTVTSRPVPALELYQGGCVPRLRDRLGADAGRRRQVLVLSARHGLVPADAPLETYDQPLTERRARVLCQPVRHALTVHLAIHPTREALLLLEPAYLQVLGTPPVPVVHVITDPVAHFGAAEKILATWGWA
ncbi:DUF6884 domain-containing protein [Streptomyces sp. PT12]|uniref:DUF6884 domain-containing protein n=1 Tax=Streptomyces sp. PT12 TaxID=1510197 RepID=UPI0011BDD9CF|nr:DUF6884 domain-containing protein [Streptomyces sp. PT12]